MQCPTCGAGVDADDYWCETCATRLVPEQDGTPNPEPEPVLVPAPRSEKAAWYVPPVPPAAPPIPVVQQRAAAPPPTAMSVFSRNLGISKWWLLIAPVVLVVAFALSMTSTDDEPAPAPKEPFKLYTTPSGAYMLHIPFEKVVRLETAVILPKTRKLDGFAATLSIGRDDYVITEAELSGSAVPDGIDHCQNNGPTAVASTGTVDGHPATLCHWDARNRSYAEAFVLRRNHLFLIEYQSRHYRDEDFQALLDGFQFFD